MKVGDLVYHVDDKEGGQIWPGIILEVWQERREYKVYFSGPGYASKEWRKPEELEVISESR